MKNIFSLKRATAYPSNWAHLSDELRRLDLLISIRCLRHSISQPSTELDKFKGLVIEEDEISNLLADHSLSAEAPEIQVLEKRLQDLSRYIEQRCAASLESGTALFLPQVATLFRLTPFEQDCVLACLGPEIDRKYEKIYAYLQDDVTRKKPSIDLLLKLFCATDDGKLSMRRAFSPDSSLLKFRLIQTIDSPNETQTPLISRFLKLDDGITNYVLGISQLDARLVSVARIEQENENLEPSFFPTDLRESLQRFLDSHFAGNNGNPRKLIFQVSGAYGSGRRSLAKHVAKHLGLGLVVGDTIKILRGSQSFEEIVWLLGREACMHSSILCLENFEALLNDEHSRYQSRTVLDVAETLSKVTMLISDRPRRDIESQKGLPIIHLNIPKPDGPRRRELWKSAIDGESDLLSDEDWGALASKFPFTEGQIREAVDVARALSYWPAAGEARVTKTNLYSACRNQSEPKFGRLARRIEPRHGWSDIVLPTESLAQLREICQQITNRDRVLGDWGFDRKLSGGKGTSALFAGPSGTGKTMAAEIIANELGLNLYKIDLSQIVSKYIGETEKNLDAVFTAAEDVNSVLFFDEADALFGKRSEVRDSHDRYANIEISYLLQKMEQYEGVAILATNLRQNLDESFVRRLAFTVHFPFPDEADRHRIWTRIWPKEIPLREDVDIDFMSHKFKLSGGNIQNVALAAAFLAAADNSSVTMPYLLKATRREFQKMGEVTTEFDLETDVISPSGRINAALKS
jgi:Winged helix domain, variant/ATPase family associated with various cellular activities (AAA)